MAIFHFSASVLSRGNGQSAVASAAYEAREKLFNEQDGKIKNYTYKSGLITSGIITPENAPDWMNDRSQLWNGVEKKENESKRRDTAQLARKFIFSLPSEMSIEENILLSKDIANKLVSYGMCIDYAIHEPDKGGDQRNYHLHASATLREINENGEFGKKNRDWNSKEFLTKLRSDIADITNKHLEKYNVKIDHRSYKDQGIEKEPTVHRGAVVTRRERQTEIINNNTDKIFDKEINNLNESVNNRIAAIERAINNFNEASKPMDKRVIGDEQKTNIKILSSGLSTPTNNYIQVKNEDEDLTKEFETIKSTPPNKIFGDLSTMPPKFEDKKSEVKTVTPPPTKPEIKTVTPPPTKPEIKTVTPPPTKPEIKIVTPPPTKPEIKIVTIEEKNNFKYIGADMKIRKVSIEKMLSDIQNELQQNMEIKNPDDNLKGKIYGLHEAEKKIKEITESKPENETNINDFIGFDKIKKKINLKDSPYSKNSVSFKNGFLEGVNRIEIYIDKLYDIELKYKKEKEEKEKGDQKKEERKITIEGSTPYINKYIEDNQGVNMNNVIDQRPAEIAKEYLKSLNTERAMWEKTIKDKKRPQDQKDYAKGSLSILKPLCNELFDFMKSTELNKDYQKVFRTYRDKYYKEKKELSTSAENAFNDGKLDMVKSLDNGFNQTVGAMANYEIIKIQNRQNQQGKKKNNSW